jgi:hypothetical protein
LQQRKPVTHAKLLTGREEQHHTAIAGRARLAAAGRAQLYLFASTMPMASRRPVALTSTAAASAVTCCRPHHRQWQDQGGFTPQQHNTSRVTCINHMCEDATKDKNTCTYGSACATEAKQCQCQRAVLLYSSQPQQSITVSCAPLLVLNLLLLLLLLLVSLLHCSRCVLE